MFNNLLKKFSKKKEEEIIPQNDFLVINADMHSHLIPGIDDGSENIENSIQMIQGLQLLGFNKLITTPHIMSDSYKNTPEIINNGLQKLKSELAKRNILIELQAAAEYYLDEQFYQTLESEPLMTFGDKYILFETSYINKPENLKEVIFKLLSQKYKPVLAHPERYNYLYNDFDEYKKLKETGVLFQININSIFGAYSPMSKKVSEDLIDNNMVDFMGTDAHSMKHIDGLRICLKEKYCQFLLENKTLQNNKL